MTKKLSTLTLLAVLATGCGTFKQYPTVIPLTDYEKQNLTCPQITNELQKLSNVRQAIAEEDKDVYKTTVDIVTDLGVGNHITKKELNQKIEHREQQLYDLKGKRGC